MGKQPFVIKGTKTTTLISSSDYASFYGYLHGVVRNVQYIPSALLLARSAPTP